MSLYEKINDHCEAIWERLERLRDRLIEARNDYEEGHGTKDEIDYQLKLLRDCGCRYEAAREVQHLLKIPVRKADV